MIFDHANGRLRRSGAASLQRLYPATIDVDSDITDIDEILLTASLQTIATIPVTKSSQMHIKILNGDQPLDMLQLASSTNGVDYTDIATTWSDYISLAGILIYTSDELVTLAAGTVGIMVLDISGSETHIRLRGSVTDTSQTSGLTGVVTQT